MRDESRSMTSLGNLDIVSLRELKQVSRHFPSCDIYWFLHTLSSEYPLFVSSVTDGLTLKYIHLKVRIVTSLLLLLPLQISLSGLFPLGFN
jgi:hypothetical protein